MEKLGWRPLSYPSADPHFDRHTNYCEDDMINIVRLRITLLMVMVLTLIWDRSVGMEGSSRDDYSKHYSILVVLLIIMILTIVIITYQLLFIFSLCLTLCWLLGYAWLFIRCKHLLTSARCGCCYRNCCAELLPELP